MPQVSAVVNIIGRIGTILLAMVLLTRSPQGARAQSGLTFQFQSDTLFATPGVTTTFIATVTNTSANNIFINGDNFTFNGPGTLDDTFFFTNFARTLTPGQSIANQNIFTVTINQPAAYGSYMGAFEIDGGASNSVQVPLAIQNFSVAVIPESSSLALLAIGLSGLAAVRIRRKTQSSCASLTPLLPRRM